MTFIETNQIRKIGVQERFGDPFSLFLYCDGLGRARIHTCHTQDAILHPCRLGFLGVSIIGHLDDVVDVHGAYLCAHASARTLI